MTDHENLPRLSIWSSMGVAVEPFNLKETNNISGRISEETARNGKRDIHNYWDRRDKKLSDESAHSWDCE